MKAFAKPLTAVLTAFAFCFAAISMPVAGKESEEKKIMHWIEKDAKKVEKLSKPVAEAAKQGEAALAKYCKEHPVKCTEVAAALVL